MLYFNLKKEQLTIIRIIMRENNPIIIILHFNYQMGNK
jgi:hypothetical protein